MVDCDPKNRPAIKNDFQAQARNVHLIGRLNPN
jgi:hypothetical protein